VVGGVGVPDPAVFVNCQARVPQGFDDLDATLADLAAKGVAAGPVRDARFGRLTTISLPSGATLGVYQPAHPLAVTLGG